MTLDIVTEPVPLAVDEHSVVRVGGTRVTLDVIVHLFQQGATAEEIAVDFPAITLADVYDAIAYYLRHTKDVDAYLSFRQDQADAAREKAERRFDPAGLRDRLLARERASSR